MSVFHDDDEEVFSSRRMILPSEPDGGGLACVVVGQDNLVRANVGDGVLLAVGGSKLLASASSVGATAGFAT